jgi:hypothetical protein
VTKLLVWPFILLSAVGLVASLCVHVASLFGLPVPLAAMGLHIGVFVVFLPAVFVMQRLTKDFKQKDLWKAALRGCPVWMKHMMYFFFGYTLFNFAIFLFQVSGKPPDDVPQVTTMRGFSGHWMAFYSAALAILYSYTQLDRFDQSRNCVNGHTVSPLAKYCEECGQSVVEVPPRVQEIG